jgi:hypothetical protein
MKKEKRIFRIASLVITGIFMCTTIVWSAPSHPVYSIKVPSKNGTVKERWKNNDTNGDTPLVVHIQDAHASLQAQENIARLIDHFISRSEDGSEKDDLSQKQRLLVCAEGAYGECDTARFSSYPDQDVREIVARQFLKKGKFTGTEYESIVSGSAFSLYGAEDRFLYKENYAAYLAVIDVKDELLEQVHTIENILHGLKITAYSADLLRLMGQTEEYQAGSLDVVPFIALLLEYAHHSKVDILPFMNIALFYEAMHLQNSISQEALTDERARLESALEQVGQAKQWRAEFEKALIGEKEYYTYLANMIDQASLEAKTFKQVTNYARYCQKMSRVDMTMLLHEIRQLRWAIEEALARTTQEKDLVFLSHTFELVRVLIQLQALSEDIDFFFTHRQNFKEAKVKNILRRVFPEKYRADIEQFDLDDTLDQVERFYRKAEERNAALVSNTIKKYERSDGVAETVLLISGGYHSGGLTAELRARDIPYVVITPAINTREPDIPYEDRMVLKLTPFESMLTHPALSTISFPLLSAREPLVDWVASVSGDSGSEPAAAQLSFSERQKVHERAVLMSLYIFGFIKFVLGDTAFVNTDTVGEAFMQKVAPLSQRDYREYLAEAAWHVGDGLDKDITFEYFSSDPRTLSFLIDSRPVGIDVPALFSAGIDTAASLSDMRLFDARMTSQQLTFLYQTIFNHLMTSPDEAEAVPEIVQERDRGDIPISNSTGTLSDAPEIVSAQQLRGGQIPLLRNTLEKWLGPDAETELTVWQVLIEQLPWAVSQIVAFLFGFSPVTFSLLGIIAVSFTGLHYVGTSEAHAPPPRADILKVVLANALAGVTAMALAPFVSIDEIVVFSVFVLGLPGLYHFRSIAGPEGRPGRGVIDPAGEAYPAESSGAERLSRRAFFSRAAFYTTAVSGALSAMPGLVSSLFAATRPEDKDLELIKRYFKDAFPASAADSRALGATGYKGGGYIQIGAFSDEKNYNFLRSVMENIPGLAIGELKVGDLYKIFVRIKKGDELKAEYEKVIGQISEYMQIDPDVVWHMIKKESRGDPFAVSSQNAHGISQVLPGTVDFVISQTRSRDSWQKKLDQMRAEGKGPGDPQYDFIQRMHRAYAPLDSIISNVYDDGERYGVSANEVRDTVTGLRDLGFYVGPLNLLFGMSYLAYITAEIDKSKALGRSEYSIVVTDPKTKKKTSKIISLPFDPNTETQVAAQMAYNTGLARIYRRVHDMGGWHNIFNTKAKGAYLTTETVDYAYQFMRDYSRMQAAKGKVYRVHPDTNTHLAMSLTALERSRMISTIDRDLKRVQLVPGSNNTKVEKHYKKEHAQWRNALATVGDRARAGTLTRSELDTLIARAENLPQWPLIKEMQSFIGRAIDNYTAEPGTVFIAAQEKVIQPEVRTIQSLKAQTKGKDFGSRVAAAPEVVREPLVNRARAAFEKRADDLQVAFAETILEPVTNRFESLAAYAMSIGLAVVFMKNRARSVREQEASLGRAPRVTRGAAFDRHLRAFEQRDGYGFISIDSDRRTHQVQLSVSTESVDMRSEHGKKAKAYVSGHYWKAWLLVRSLNIILPLLFGSEKIFLRPFQARSIQSDTASRFHFQVQVPRKTIFHLGLFVASIFTLAPLFYFFPAAVSTGLVGYTLARIVFVVMPFITSIESRSIRRVVYGGFLAAIIMAGLHFSAQFSYAASAVESSSVLSVFTSFVAGATALFVFTVAGGDEPPAPGERSGPEKEEATTFGGEPISADDFAIMKDVFTYLERNIYVRDGATYDGTRSILRQTMRRYFGQEKIDPKDVRISLSHDPHGVSVDDFEEDDTLHIKVSYKGEVPIGDFYLRRVYDERQSEDALKPRKGIYINWSESHIVGIDMRSVGVGTFLRKALFTVLKEKGFHSVLSSPRSKTRHIMTNTEWGLGVAQETFTMTEARREVDGIVQERLYLADEAREEGESVFLERSLGVALDTFNEKAFQAELARLQEPEIKTVYVFINAEALSDGTMCDFSRANQVALEKTARIIPVFFSFDSSSKEIETRLADLGRSDLKDAQIAGRDELEYAPTEADKIELLLRFFNVQESPQEVIIIDRGEDADSLSPIGEFVVSNKVGWLGLVNPDFPFNDIRTVKDLARAGKHAATVLTHITHFMERIGQGGVPEDGTVVLAAIAELSPEMQASLLATIAQIEREVMVRQAA